MAIKNHFSQVRLSDEDNSPKYYKSIQLLLSFIRFRLNPHFCSTWLIFALPLVSASIDISNKLTLFRQAFSPQPSPISRFRPCVRICLCSNLIYAYVIISVVVSTILQTKGGRNEVADSVTVSQQIMEEKVRNGLYYFIVLA